MWGNGEGAEEAINFEVVTKSFETALNAGDAEVLTSLWSTDGGWVELYMDPENATDLLLCEGLLNNCMQTVVDRADSWRFIDVVPGVDSVCFKLEFSDDGINWNRTRKGGATQLQFDGKGIGYFGWGCTFNY
jgi:hypothetical protein